jgi:hypothetical protein
MSNVDAKAGHRWSIGCGEDVSRIPIGVSAIRGGLPTGADRHRLAGTQPLSADRVVPTRLDRSHCGTL